MSKPCLFASEKKKNQQPPKHIHSLLMEKPQHLAHSILEQENKHSPVEKVTAQTPVNICQAFLQKINPVLWKSSEDG